MPGVLRRLIRLVQERIAVKLTLTLVGFVAIASLAAGLYLSQALDRFAAESLEARLVTGGRLLHDDVRALLRRPAGAAELGAFARRSAAPTESRVTIMALDGTVVADSEVAPEDLGRLENHAARPEMRAALAGHVGRDLRTSVSINAPLLYVALPVREAERVVGVVRLALPLSAVTSSYGRVHRVLLAGGLLALAVAFGIGIFLARRATRPVGDLQCMPRQMSGGEVAVR